MIIDAIRLYSAQGVGENEDLTQYAELGLNLVSLNDSYILEQGFGFDIEEVSPRFYGNYSTDNFYEMVLKTRTVVLKIKLNPQISESETPSSLRDALYKLVSATRTSLVDIRLMYGGQPVAYILGRVKKFESAIFDSNPKIQITFECDYPLFRSVDVVDVTEDGEIDVGDDLTDNVLQITDSLSTAPHGFTMRLHVDADVGDDTGGLTFQNIAGTEEQPFSILRTGANPFAFGDVIYFCSCDDDKYLYMIREDVTTNLVDTLGPNPVWPIMFPGVTNLDLGDKDLTIQSFTYQNHYWGV